MHNCNPDSKPSAQQLTEVLEYKCVYAANNLSPIGMKIKRNNQQHRIVINVFEHTLA